MKDMKVIIAVINGIFTVVLLALLVVLNIAVIMNTGGISATESIFAVGLIITFDALIIIRIIDLWSL